MYGNFEKVCFERLEKENCNFDTKKKITSAIRRVLPNGHTNNIIFTANHRALRHIIEMRTSPHAEEEIVFVFNKILGILKDKFPNIYYDIGA